MDHKAQRWLVIDGLQRISTIVRFLEGGDWTLSNLEDIEPAIAGKSAAAIKPKTSTLHQYYTRVENLSVPVTVLRCDFNKKSHMKYLFTIFHRLNTGGVKLNNQEIRNCIYGGSFNELLRACDKYPAWRSLNKMEEGTLYRFTKQELILRFFAFQERSEAYEGHLAGFLNNYMHDHQNDDAAAIDGKKSLFERTVSCAFSKIFASSEPPNLSLTVMEALLVGIGKNIGALENESSETLQARFKELQTHPEFSETALKEGLSKRPRVISRLQIAADIFRGQ